MPRCLQERLQIEATLQDEPPELTTYITDIWKPDCDDQGQYKLKQCKKKRCFCVSPEGERLFGYAEAFLAKNMTCLCSLALFKKMKIEGEKWMTNHREHCTDLGNFARLQCVDDVCYCVDEMTGETQGRIVKENQKESLPCYEMEDFEEGSYLSRCEKQVVRERHLQYSFSRKGMTISRSDSLKCDIDGTFAPRQCKGSTCRCTDTKGVSFESYSMDKVGREQNKMICRCARDQIENQRHGARYPQSTCNGIGNYANYQEREDGGFCVDEDGDEISNKFQGFPPSIKPEEFCAEMAQRLKLPDSINVD